MKWDMEIMPPGPFVSSSSNSSWMFEDTRNTKWTPEENKAFENALAKYDKDTPDRWHRVAEMVPGKTVSDVIMQYKELEDDVSSIEAGLFPFAGYSSPSSTFTLEWGGSQLGYDGFKQFSGASTSKKSPNGRPSEQERKKGVPWTEEEHKLFLMGLKKYGKGDWRNISRNFVVSRTPTQVASHAQKYFIRQLSERKDKRRASIHDITTVNLSEDHQIPSPDSAKKDQSPSSSSKMAFNPWNHQTVGSNGSSSSSPVMSFNMDHGNFFAAQGQNHHGVNVMHNNHHHGSYLGCQGLAFQMQPAHHYPHA